MDDADAPRWWQRLGWAQFALFAACLAHDRISLRWTVPACKSDAAPAIYGVPLPEHMWAYVSLEWHVWLPAYLLNLAALWLLLLPLAWPLRHAGWAARNGWKAGLAALIFVALDLAAPGNHLHLRASHTFLPASYGPLHVVGWSTHTRSYMCDESN